MLTNQDGNILIANSINFANNKISVTTYNDITHYNSGDTTYLKKVSSTIVIPSGFEYPVCYLNESLNSDAAIKSLIELIIKTIDNNWTEV